MAVVRSAGGSVPRRSADAAGTRARSQAPIDAAPMASHPERAGGEELAAADPAPARSARCVAPIRSSSSSVTALPAAAPSTPLITAEGRAASGSNAAATMPTTANTANPTTTPTRERRPRTPSAAPHTSATTTIPISSAFLSRSPNVRMAKPFERAGQPHHEARRHRPDQRRPGAVEDRGRELDRAERTPGADDTRATRPRGRRSSVPDPPVRAPRLSPPAHLSTLAGVARCRR